MVTDTHKATLVHVEPREGQRMHPLVNAAMSHAGTLDPATLRELLAVQREWEAGEARKAYTRAMAALKADLPTVIRKDATVDYTSRKTGERTFYTHASLAGIMDEITDPLTRHGFSLSWTPRTSERAIEVTCRLTHAEGHSEECALSAPPDASGNKSPAQAIASTVTLLSRYTALALLGIATRDMREPTGETIEEPTDAHAHVDIKHNMRACAAIVRAGRTKAAAERHVGRPVSEWTSADLAKLRTWLRPAPDTGEVNPDAEPTDEELEAARRARGDAA